MGVAALVCRVRVVEQVLLGVQEVGANVPVTPMDERGAEGLTRAVKATLAAAPAVLVAVMRFVPALPCSTLTGEF